MNSRAMQKHRVNKLALSDHAKRALKRATSWYARKNTIPGGGGLLLYQIAKKVKRGYDGIGPHPAKIQKYVNANIAGMSPLKPGVKGSSLFASHLRVMFASSRSTRGRGRG
jgi:hypothetical protein